MYDLIMVNNIGPGFTHKTPALGGSEWEMIQVATGLAKRGYHVAVANGVEREERFNMGAGSVRYVPLSRLRTSAEFSKAKTVWLERTTPDEYLAPGFTYERAVVRATDIYFHGYDVHKRLFHQIPHAAKLVVNTHWQANVFPINLGGGDRAVIIPSILDPTPPVEKKPGLFVFTSAPMKGLKETLAHWRALYRHWDADIMRKRGVELVIIVPGFSDFYGDKVPELTDEDKRDFKISFQGAPSLEEYRKAIAQAEGLFYVNTMPETLCVHGDTRIAIPGNHRDGHPTAKIADLVGMSGFPVYAYDQEADRFRIATCSQVWRARFADELVEVVLDSGQSLKLTPDHRVMTYHREWKAAGDLQPGESLLALNYRYDVMIQDGNGRWTSESRLVGSWMKGGRPLIRNEHVDHLDPERLDNTPSMLQVLMAR